MIEIEYLVYGAFGAGIVAGIGLKIRRHIQLNKFYKKFNNEVEKLCQKVDQFTDKDYEKIANALKNNLSDEELMDLKYQMNQTIENNNKFLNKYKDLSSRLE